GPAAAPAAVGVSLAAALFDLSDTCLLVRRASGFADLEAPNEERQRQADTHHQPQQAKTIHKSQHVSLLTHEARNESVRLLDRIWPARSTRHQVLARPIHNLSKPTVRGREPAHQDAFVVLRP